MAGWRWCAGVFVCVCVFSCTGGSLFLSALHSWVRLLCWVLRQQNACRVVSDARRWRLPDCSIGNLLTHQHPASVLRSVCAVFLLFFAEMLYHSLDLLNAECPKKNTCFVVAARVVVRGAFCCREDGTTLDVLFLLCPPPVESSTLQRSVDVSSSRQGYLSAVFLQEGWMRTYNM